MVGRGLEWQVYLSGIVLELLLYFAFKGFSIPEDALGSIPEELYISKLVSGMETSQFI